MSGIICIAPFLALLVAVLVRVGGQIIATCWGVDRNGWWLGCLAPLVVFPIACTANLNWLPPAMTRTGFGVSASEANAELLLIKVPAKATQVDFRHNQFYGLTDAADFDLPEADFLEWMAAEKRTPARFTVSKTGEVLAPEWKPRERHHYRAHNDVTPVALLHEPGSHRVDIKNGYYFDDYAQRQSHDNGLTVIYDLDRQRVYMRRTTF